ncbi:MAG TPA: glucose dehydrogenase [Candidatus Bathyarchaeota archaeon]|nr:glucose dehydrogenase [Candidatus Bathyarchaeota archaeon]
MKALVVKPPKRNSVELAEISTPVPSENQVLLETLCVGIDGTDREINEGAYGEPPEGSDFLVLGHEALARISAVGDSVRGFSLGDLVVPTVRRPCWENCLNCRNGEVSMCLTGNYYEHGIYKLHGFASEYALCDSDFLVKIPDELENVAVLLEPLSVVEKAVSQVFKIQQRMIWEPKRALVLGAGSLGLLAAMLLRLKGLEVYCLATQPKDSLKADIVNHVGGTYVNATETPLKKLSVNFDLIVEATGNVSVAIDSLPLLDVNGVLCFLGVYREKMACQDFGKVLTRMVLGNRLMFGSVNSDKVHFEAGIHDLFDIQRRYGKVVERLITEKLGAEDFRRAFLHEETTIKTLVCFK